VLITDGCDVSELSIRNGQRHIFIRLPRDKYVIPLRFACEGSIVELPTVTGADGFSAVRVVVVPFGAGTTRIEPRSRNATLEPVIDTEQRARALECVRTRFHILPPVRGHRAPHPRTEPRRPRVMAACRPIRLAQMPMRKTPHRGSTRTLARARALHASDNQTSERETHKRPGPRHASGLAVISAMRGVS